MKRKHQRSFVPNIDPKRRAGYATQPDPVYLPLKFKKGDLVKVVGPIADRRFSTYTENARSQWGKILKVTQIIRVSTPRQMPYCLEGVWFFEDELELVFESGF